MPQVSGGWITGAEVAGFMWDSVKELNLSVWFGRDAKLISASWKGWFLAPTPGHGFMALRVRARALRWSFPRSHVSRFSEVNYQGAISFLLGGREDKQGRPLLRQRGVGSLPVIKPSLVRQKASDWWRNKRGAQTEWGPALIHGDFCAHRFHAQFVNFAYLKCIPKINFVSNSR